MPPKQWSRQEEVKKLKDRMTEIQEASSDLAKLSKKRQDALHAAVPGIHPQQENTVLQSAADWSKFYEDDTAWLQQKARLEAQQLLDTNEALHKIEHENAALRVQLDDLKIVKKEPGVESAEWPVIYEIRDLMLEQPKMVQVFFDHGFIGKLEETFKTNWDNFDERIDALERSVYGAIHVASEEVKEYLETNFIPRLSLAMQELRAAHTDALDTNKKLEVQYDEVKVRLDEREKELAESQAEHQSALQRVRELESRCSLVDSLHEGSKEELVESQAEHQKALQRAEYSESRCALVDSLYKVSEEELVESQAEHQRALQKTAELESKCAQDSLLYKEREEELVKSQAAHAKALNTIKELESQCAQSKVLFKKHEEELINDLATKLAAEKKKLRDFEEQATRHSSKIAGLKFKDDKEKELEKAMLQHREMDAWYSLLARLTFTKTPAISARPIQELKTIVTRAAGFIQSTASLDPARILDSHNTDLPEGTQLIADVSDVFILIAAPGKVEIFDKADIECFEHDTLSGIRLIMDEKTLVLHARLHNTEKADACDSWIDTYAEGVVSRLVLATEL